MLQRLYLCCAALLLLVGPLRADVEGKSQGIYSGADTVSNGEDKPLDFVWAPSISLGAGMFTFYGDVGNNHQFYHPTVSRPGFDLRLSNPLIDELDLGFYVLRGQLGANERTLDRNLNFESTITAGGFTLTYDFGNFLKEDRVASPFLSVGFESFEFLSKTDLYDEDGNRYHYWSDGSIKDRPEGASDADNANELTRDYTYETDLRELNLDGFGKYQERSWGIPVGIGANLKLGERVDLRLRTQMHFTLTDYIDNVTSESMGNRAGDPANDKFLFTSFALRYDLQLKGEEDQRKDIDPMGGKELLAGGADEDEDGVFDVYDDCPHTPANEKVGDQGCPSDQDGDGVPDHMDDEVKTDSALINQVDGKGVALTDTMLKMRYLEWVDSTGRFVETTDTVHSLASSIFRFPRKEGKKEGDKEEQEPSSPTRKYMVKVGGDEQRISEETRNQILSLKDVRTLQKGDTTIYVVGDYDKLPSAIRRKLQLEDEGFEGTVVVSHQEGDQGIRVEEKQMLSGEKPAEVEEGETVFRVQIGAYSKKVSRNVFADVNDLLVIKGDDGLYRYLTGSFDNITDAASHKTDMYMKGYDGAFLSAYRSGERITLDEAGATVKGEDKDELIDESQSSSVDKSLVKFRVQVGLFKDKVPTATLEKMLELKNIKPRTTENDAIRYITGTYDSYQEAEKVKKEIREKGINGAFVVGDFNGKIIPAKEAMDLLNQ